MARNINIKDYMRIDRSMGFYSYAPRILGWAIVVSVVIWIVMGLVSLRFDLSGSVEDVFYSQMIVAAIILVCLLNIYIIDSGGFGARDGWRYMSYSPLLWALMTSVGLLMLLWHIWIDFEGLPNEILKLTYSLMGVGLCGTFAGIVSLAVIERLYRPLVWSMHLLTAIVGVETVEALWTVDVLSLNDAGIDFGWVGVVCVVAVSFYTFVAFLMRRSDSAKARMKALIVYVFIGLVGFGIGLVTLWDEMDAGPRRFVFGAALLLSICAVSLYLLHHYYRNPPGRISNDSTESSDSNTPNSSRSQVSFDRP